MNSLAGCAGQSNRRLEFVEHNALFALVPRRVIPDVDGRLEDLDALATNVQACLRSLGRALAHSRPLALSPNGKVPTLVIDGAPMVEALAILQWLGDSFGVERGQWPAAGTGERLEALSWSTWSYVTFGGTMQRFIHASSERVPAEGHNKAQAKFAADELQSYLALLEARLDGRSHLLGAGFSLLDLIVGGVVTYATVYGVPTDDHPRFAAWVERFKARDAY